MEQVANKATSLAFNGATGDRHIQLIVIGPDDNGVFTVNANKSFVEENPSSATLTVVIRRLGSPDTTVTDSIQSIDAQLTASPNTIAANAQNGLRRYGGDLP